jgi:hypothetical protein
MRERDFSIDSISFCKTYSICICICICICIFDSFGGNMRNIRTFSLAALAGVGFMLTGCGDSGGGVASTPTPPSPPPPPVYSTYTGLTGNQTFNTAAVRAQLTATGVGVSVQGGSLGTGNLTVFQPAPFGNTVTIGYNAAASTYTINAPNNTVLNFGPADLLTATTNPANTNPKAISYAVLTGTQVTSQFTIYTPVAGGVDLTYTRVGWGVLPSNIGTPFPTFDFISGVFGVPTVASDMPTTGSATYSKVTIDGFASVCPPCLRPQQPGGLNYYLTGSTATFSANFATGAIQTQLNLVHSAPPGIPASFYPALGPATLTGTGSITSGTSAFTGTIGAGGPYSNGAFTGQFFGPQAAEFGYNFALTSTITGNGAFGTVTGAK